MISLNFKKDNGNWILQHSLIKVNIPDEDCGFIEEAAKYLGDEFNFRLFINQKDNLHCCIFSKIEEDKTGATYKIEDCIFEFNTKELHFGNYYKKILTEFPDKMNIIF